MKKIALLLLALSITQASLSVVSCNQTKDKSFTMYTETNKNKEIQVIKYDSDKGISYEYTITGEETITGEKAEKKYLELEKKYQQQQRLEKNDVTAKYLKIVFPKH